MDTVNYVNKTGKLINNSTKYNAKLDKVSITNLVLINHLNDILIWIENNKNNLDEYPLLTEDNISKINNYINCLKKQINFYPEKYVSPDCILTEVEEFITQE